MFLICGEALFDIFVAGQDGATMKLDAVPGGSPFNVAVGLARLGQRVEFMSGVSTDFMGSKLMDVIAKEGVGRAYTARKTGRTTLSLVGLDAVGGPAYSFYGEGAADRTFDRQDIPELGADIGIIHIGSFSTIVSPVGPTLQHLVAREGDRRLVSYDPNIRLNVEPSVDMWRNAFDVILPHVAIIKISQEDLELLMPGITAEGFAELCQGKGVSLTIVTNGGEGSRAWSNTGVATVPATPITMVDSVGAGDTFQAALLARVVENGWNNRSKLSTLEVAELEDLLGFAGQASAITCSRRGADMPRRAEIKGFPTD